VLITHGRARRRMIGFAVEVGAAAARARIPERIADALA
jgi:fatty acid/phospholipid biosynthesis enzyme